MNFKDLVSKAKDFAQDLQNRTSDFKESETYTHGVSIIKETWGKLKNKRIKIEDKGELSTSNTASDESTPVAKKAPTKKPTVKKTTVKKASTKKATPKTTAKKAPVKKSTSTAKKATNKTTTKKEES